MTFRCHFLYLSVIWCQKPGCLICYSDEPCQCGSPKLDTVSGDKNCCLGDSVWICCEVLLSFPATVAVDAWKLLFNSVYSLFVYGAMAPSGPGRSHSRGFHIRHNDAPQSVGILWTSDQLVAVTST